MRASFSHLNELWGDLVIEELVRTGVTCFVLSPGSRSTPLVCAVSQNKLARPVVHFDERGAAFYALGHAKASGIPAALICTSGTAAANYFPSVIEASIDHVPLIILSADRPPELRATGANQTINQVKLYGDYVRYQMDIPCPDEKIPPEFVLTTIDQALYRAQRSPAGPVHLNFMFREPLAPNGKGESFKKYLQSIAGWIKSSSPYTEYSHPVSELPQVTLKKIASIINKSKAGLIVAGKLSGWDTPPVLALSKKIGWPIFPEIASGLRLGVKNSNVIPFYDQLLLSDNLKKYVPDTVLHFGSQPVSKRLLQLLESARPKNYIRIADFPERHDPNHQVTWRIECGISEFCSQIVERVSQKSAGRQVEQLKIWSNAVAGTLKKMLEAPQSEIITEPAVARIISAHILKDSALFLASSLPVREMDMYAVADGANILVEYNRSASGIDGTLASAIGYSDGLKRPVTLFIGDLAFLHDLNSLALVKQSKFPITIVVVNNNGGGIFSFLPVAEIGKEFEKFFGTPHGLSFEKSAGQFGISYHHPNSINAFTGTYIAAQKKKNSSIIEITTERRANFEFNKQISRAVRTALEKS